MKAPQPTEKQLQSCIIDYWLQFRLPGTCVAAIPNQRAFGQPGLQRGLPDLLCYGGSWPMKGITIYIELKVGKNKLSEHQVTIRDEMIAAGVPHFVCRTFEEAHDILVRYGICKPVTKLARRAA